MDYRNYPDNDGIPPNTQGKVTPRKSFVRRFIWQIIAIVSVVLVIFLAYSNISMRFAPKNTAVVPVPTSQSGPQTPTAIPATPTPTPTDTTNATNTSTPVSTAAVPVQTGLPCKVDLSTWTDGSGDWKILNGALLNDGTGNWDNQGPTIVAPCQLGSTTNYAVEAQIQVVSTGNNPCFGITVRGTPSSNGWQGYKAGVGDCGYYGLSSAYIGGSSYNNDQAEKSATFNPTTTKHTYRVEARNNTITFFIDGGQILTMNDNRYLTGAEVGLWSQGTQLDVFSLQVVAL
jgi:hypothetical protein